MGYLDATISDVSTFHWWKQFSERHKYFKLAGGIFLFASAYALAFRLAADRNGASFSPLWVPNSILFCALLRSRPRHWWIFLLTTVPIRLIEGAFAEAPLWYRIGIATVNGAEAMAAAWSFRLIAPNPGRFGTWREWLGMGAVLLTATTAAFPTAALRHGLGQDYWLAWQLGFVGDALALLVIAPALITWLFWNGPPVPPINRASALEATGVLAGLVLTTYLAYWSNLSFLNFVDSRFFLPVPFLYWAAFRFGMAGASVAVPILAFMALDSVLLKQSIFTLQQAIFSDTFPVTAAPIVLSRFLLFRTLPVYVVAGMVEQRHLALHSLIESESRFREMANTAPVLIWRSSAGRLRDFFNQGWLDFTGRPPEAELGNGWTEGIHPDDLEHCLQTCAKACEARKPFRTEYRLRNRVGQYRWILDVGVPRFRANNVFCGYIGSALDITDQRQAQEDISHIARLQRLAQMGEFTASIAHELRQPLCGQHLHIETLRTLLRSANISTPEIQDILTDIDKDGQRANDVLIGIRNMMQKADNPLEPVDINALVLNCKSLILHEASRRHVRIETDLADDLPLVNGARTGLMQVLLNLAFNAMDAMEDTPRADRCLTIRTEHHEQSVQISVLDRGHGIKPEHMGLLFNSFFTTRPKGMGLGLSIVRSIVDAHHGRVWAEHFGSGGTTIHVVLPVGQSHLGWSRPTALRR